MFVRGDALVDERSSLSTAVEVDAVAEELLVDGRGLFECFDDEGDACDMFESPLYPLKRFPSLFRIVVDR